MAGNVRKTWDREYYQAKADARKQDGDDEIVGSIPIAAKVKNWDEVKEEFRPADTTGLFEGDRAFIKARETKIIDSINDKIGKVEIIKPDTVQAARGAGFFCEVCECTLKDSEAYLRHITGKKHQKALGFSMRTEKASYEGVKDKLALLKRKVEESSNPSNNNNNKPSVIDEYNARIATESSEQEMLKKKKKEEIEARRKEAEEIENELIDPDIAAIMGFGTFKKK